MNNDNRLEIVRKKMGKLALAAIIPLSMASCGKKHEIRTDDTSSLKATETKTTAKNSASGVYDIEQSKKLLKAAGNGHLNDVKKAIENGADINAQDTKTGKTALMLALEKIDHTGRSLSEIAEGDLIDYCDVARYLINNKDIDLSIEDNRGCNALDYATASVEYSHRYTRDMDSKVYVTSLKRNIEENMNKQKENSHMNAQTYNMARDFQYSK